MECDGDREHLAPLRYVPMNDGMGVYSCGLDREVREGENAPHCNHSRSQGGGGSLALPVFSLSLG